MCCSRPPSGARPGTRGRVPAVELTAGARFHPRQHEIPPRRRAFMGVPFFVLGYVRLEVRLPAPGGIPDLGRITSHCVEHPDRVCRILQERGTDLSIPATDARLHLRFAGACKVPVQLWRAGSDEITPHPWNAEAIFSASPTRPEYAVVANAGHFAIIACSEEMVQRAALVVPRCS